MVFQLTLGCENDCSHCVNHMLGPVVKFDIDALVEDIKSKREKYETRTFVNIDPNTACYDLERFGFRCPPFAIKAAEGRQVSGVSKNTILNTDLFVTAGEHRRKTIFFMSGCDTANRNLLLTPDT